MFLLDFMLHVCACACMLVCHWSTIKYQRREWKVCLASSVTSQCKLNLILHGLNVAPTLKGNTDRLLHTYSWLTLWKSVEASCSVLKFTVWWPFDFRRGNRRPWQQTFPLHSLNISAGYWWSMDAIATNGLLHLGNSSCTGGWSFPPCR